MPLNSWTGQPGTTGSGPESVLRQALMPKSDTTAEAVRDLAAAVHRLASAVERAGLTAELRALIRGVKGEVHGER